MPHTGIRKQAMNHSMTNPLLATQLLIKAWRILLVLVCSMASTHAALPDHPRLLFPESAEAPLQQRIQTDPLAGKLYLGLLRQADHAISLPVCRYDIPDGKRLLAQSRYALSNILHCSMAWRLSGKTKYYDRAILEMDAACGLKDWNPSHFLDTAEMSTAVAIGYDWLYQKLTPAQRQSYAKALREKGLEPARKGFTGKLSWWANPRNNWGQVCATGLLLAERALENEGDPIHAGRIEASKSLDQCKKFYQPGGAYPEGPGYWHYGSKYHVLGLATLQTDHSSLRIPTPPEFKASALFTEHLTGPTGLVFNFADSGRSTSKISAAQSWMASAFKDPSTCAWIRSRLTEDIKKNRKNSTSRYDRFFPLHLLWLPYEPKKTPHPLPTDSQWQGSQPVATFRSSWNDPHALFVAMKGGYPGASHGQMDVGSFILECDGVRWAEDLGSDNYNMPGYFGSKRWNYYRLTNLSHNTLVFGGKPQNAKAAPCPLIEFKSTHQTGNARFDITSAYQGQAKQIIRSCTLDRTQQKVTITDKITDAAFPVRWAIVTRAKINIQGKAVTLSQSGKNLTILRNDSHGGEWTVLDAKPKLDIEHQNKGIQILAFTAPATKDLELSVTFKRP